MQTIIDAIHKGKKEYFIRKSRWLFLLIVIKVIFFFLFTVGLLYIIYYVLDKFDNNNFQFLSIVLIYIILFISYVTILVAIVSYFYNVLIITNKGIYKLKLGLFFNEEIDIIDLYKIQEIKSQTNGFLNVLLNVGELHLVEQKDTEKIIHFIDKPEYIAKIIKGVQHKLIENRYKK